MSLKEIWHQKSQIIIWGNLYKNYFGKLLAKKY